MKEPEVCENGSGLRQHKAKQEEKKKKKRRRMEGQENDSIAATEKGSEGNGRQQQQKPTVSIAVAGSIIDNAQSLELCTLLAGQIARAATIFRIDEVVVFDSVTSSDDGSIVGTASSDVEDESGAQFLVRILQYLETPQYLRRRLFPMHSSLKFVGILPPLDAPHHVRKHEWSLFREGVTLESNPLKSKGTLVDVGLSKNIMVEEVLEPGKRVTVVMGDNRSLEADYSRKILSSSLRNQMGSYWGYQVRYASNLSGVFRNCPYEGGYDHIIGTSEHGSIINSSELTIPSFRHLLIAFGGLGGLEENIEEDSSLKGKSIREIFPSYLNICPLQGSRTIRTEEAIFISLQYFQDPIRRAQPGRHDD